MISAYIMPHPPIARHEVGRGEEKKIQSTIDAYKKVSKMIAEDAPETTVVVSPHSVIFGDAYYIAGGRRWSGNLAHFNAPSVALSYENDVELAEEVVRLCDEKEIPIVYTEQGTERPDHGSVVPLSFINEEYNAFKILRISPSFISNDSLLEMGRIIERAAAHVGRKISFLASGDLSHKLKSDGPYGFAKEGPEFDELVTAAMKECDFAAFEKFDENFLEEAAECGLPGFIMMAGALSDYYVTSEFLSYEGTFGVGYAICAFKCEDIYVNLAKKSIETYIKTGDYLKRPDNLPEQLLNNRAGVFVSIHKEGRLRGCIGTITACTDCVADEIISLAVEAATRDPRFYPVSEDELGLLEINVDVLADAEPAKFEELDAKMFGVIVSKGMRRGLLLPNLEGVDSPSEQIEIALQKAGIAAHENYKLEKFIVERHT